jgi:hypothetical protein
MKYIPCHLLPTFRLICDILVSTSTHSGDAMAASFASILGPSTAPSRSATAAAAPDSFKTEYHLKSGCPTVYESFSAFASKPPPLPIPDREPWKPFISREDFEFAEIMHTAAMSKELTDKLLHLVWRITVGRTETDFLLKNHADINAAWARAAPQLTPVSFEKLSLFNSIV